MVSGCRNELVASPEFRRAFLVAFVMFKFLDVSDAAKLLPLGLSTKPTATATVFSGVVNKHALNNVASVTVQVYQAPPPAAIPALGLATFQVILPVVWATITDGF